MEPPIEFKSDRITSNSYLAASRFHEIWWKDVLVLSEFKSHAGVPTRLATRMYFDTQTAATKRSSSGEDDLDGTVRQTVRLLS